MSVRSAVERLFVRLRSPKHVRSRLVFWMVLVIVFAGTFVVSSLPLGLYTPTVGFQQSRHRQLPRQRPQAPVVSPVGRTVYRGLHQRVVAIGDLHGDLDRLRNVLRAAEILEDDTDTWREGCTDIVVQLGDVVDRGPDAPLILQLLHRLKGEAARAGGRLITLNGNHELMSLMGDTDYAHPRLLEESGGALGFRHLYGVGGRYGRMFVEDNAAAAIVSDVVYVHGGLTENFASYGINKLNHELWYQGALDMNLSHHAFHAEDSPVWDRSVVQAAMQGDCKPLDKSLKALGDVERIKIGAMVVGHTMMPGGKVGMWCQGRLVTADVGMSRYIEGGGYEAYVTVDPYTASWKRRRQPTSSRIHVKYPLGAAVLVATNTPNTTALVDSTDST